MLVSENVSGAGRAGGRDSAISVQNNRKDDLAVQDFDERKV